MVNQTLRGGIVLALLLVSSTVAFAKPDDCPEARDAIAEAKKNESLDQGEESVLVGMIADHRPCTEIKSRAEGFFQVKLALTSEAIVTPESDKMRAELRDPNFSPEVIKAKLVVYGAIKRKLDAEKIISSQATGFRADVGAANDAKAVAEVKAKVDAAGV